MKKNNDNMWESQMDTLLRQQSRERQLELPLFDDDVDTLKDLDSSRQRTEEYFDDDRRYNYGIFPQEV